MRDLRDAARIRAVFRERRPEVVFHAAALKHLALLQRHPGEAVKTTIWGTLAVLEAAEGVERFVNISTDKAANPSSLLGLSKRLTAPAARRAPSSACVSATSWAAGVRSSPRSARRSPPAKTGRRPIHPLISHVEVPPLDPLPARRLDPEPDPAELTARLAAVCDTPPVAARHPDAA